MTNQREAAEGDMDADAVKQVFDDKEVEVILKQDNLTFLALKDQLNGHSNPAHPAVKGPLVMIEDSELW